MVERDDDEQAATEELTGDEQDALDAVEECLDTTPAQAAAAIPGIPPFLQALLLRVLTKTAGPPLLAFVGKQVLKETVTRAQADALEVGGVVDLGAADNARGREWSFVAQAGEKRGGGQ